MAGPFGTSPSLTVLAGVRGIAGSIPAGLSGKHLRSRALALPSRVGSRAGAGRWERSGRARCGGMLSRWAGVRREPRSRWLQQMRRM